MKFRLSLLLLGLLLVFASVALAQDTIGTPTGPDIVGITGDPASFYGQQVTVEGTVNELVNIRSFLLGADSSGANQLLVLNNTGQEFNIGLTKDARVTVTGTIYPSFNQGGWDQVMAAIPTTGAATTGADMAAGQDTTANMATAEATVMTGEDTTAGMATAEATEMSGMATAEAGVSGETTMAETTTAPMGIGLSEYPTVMFTNRFPDHTILLVDSMDDIQFVVTEATPAQ